MESMQKNLAGANSYTFSCQSARTILRHLYSLACSLHSPRPYNPGAQPFHLGIVG
jgi:hypothetical protein